MAKRRVQKLIGGPASSRNLIVSQIIGQLALFLAIPFLTRQMPLEEMGIYQIGFSLALVLQPLATLRKEMTIPFVSGQEAKKHRLAGFVMAVSLTLTVALFAGVVFISGNLEIAAGAASTAMILAALSLISIENAYLIRWRAQDRLALRNLIGGLASAALQVLAAYTFGSAVAVAAAYLIGRVIATVTTFASGSLIVLSEAEGTQNKQRPASTIMSAVIASSSSQAIVIGSVLTLGSSAGAQVAIAQRVASTPITLVSQAMVQVLLSAAAPIIRQKKRGLSRMLGTQTLRVAAFSVFVAIALALGGPLLAGPVLGDEWEFAGTLIAVFAAPLCLMLISLPATTLLIPLGKERLLVVLQTVRLIAILTTLVVSGLVLHDVFYVCLLTSVVWTVAYLPFLYAAFKATREHDDLALAKAHSTVVRSTD